VFISQHITKFLFISFLLITQLCDAQFINNRYSFVNSLSNVGWNAVENDSGYVLVGGTNSGYAEIGITQTDFSGNIIFQKTWGQSGLSYFAGFQNSLTKLMNGGYAMFGGTTIGSPLNNYATLFRFDESGDTLWTKNYGDTSYFQSGKHMRQTLDGGFILFGDNSTPSEYLWVIKTDSLGIIEWEQTYGGPNYEGAAHIAVCADGGYIFSGNTKSLGPNIPNEVNIRIMKIDSLGNEEFTKVLGEDGLDAPWGIEQTQDGGYIFGGSIKHDSDNVTKPYAVKLDALGNTVWETSPKPPNGNGSTAFYGILELSDSSFVAAGNQFDTDSLTWGRYEGLVVKMNQNGDTLWRKLYRIPGMDATGTDFRIFDIRPTSDGGFICAGTVYPAFPDTGTQDMWLLKIDSNGCADTACTLITSLPNTQNSQLNTNSLAVYPNPTNGIVTIELPKESTSGSFRLLNINGKEVFNQNLNSSANQIDVSHLSKGIYFYRYRDNKQGYAGKLVIN
jgi:hypothetical protein